MKEKIKFISNFVVKPRKYKTLFFFFSSVNLVLFIILFFNGKHIEVEVSTLKWFVLSIPMSMLGALITSAQWKVFSWCIRNIFFYEKT